MERHGKGRKDEGTREEAALVATEKVKLKRKYVENTVAVKQKYRLWEKGKCHSTGETMH